MTILAMNSYYLEQSRKAQKELEPLLEKHGTGKPDVWPVFGEGKPMYCVRYWDSGVRFYADAETPEELVQKVKDFINGG